MGPAAYPERIFSEVLDENLGGMGSTVQAAAPIMVEYDCGGAMVLISSILGLAGPDGLDFAGAYAPSKQGIVWLMRTFAHWLAPHSVRLNTVLPTGVESP